MAGAQEAVASAWQRWRTAEQVLGHVVLPAITCIYRLRDGGQLALSDYKASMHLLERLAEQVVGQAALREDRGRSLFICCGPGETEEHGAKITSQLAMIHGWQVHFGGAGLRQEELVFALGRLDPDVLLIECETAGGLDLVRQQIVQLERAAIRPRIQIAVAGAAVESPEVMTLELRADLVGRDAVEALEVMELCPEHRAALPPPPPVSEPPAARRRWAWGAGDRLHCN